MPNRFKQTLVRVLVLALLVSTIGWLPLPSSTVQAQQDGRMLNVPEDYATIAEAFFAAEDGDTVRVAAGTYTLATGLSLPVGVSLVGEERDTTIIENQGTGSAISARGNNRIEALTIKGTHPESAERGPGIYVRSGPVTIHDTHITASSSGIVSSCTRSSDTDDCSLLVEESLIDENLSTGIAAFDDAVLTARYTIIARNDGSGIFSAGNAVLDVSQNTIVENGQAMYSSGVYLVSEQSSVINNIIVGTNGFGVHNFVGATVHHNNVWSNTGSDYYGCDPGVGGLSLDPMFRDMHNGDYHLQAGSPAIASGSPVWTDMGALPFVPTGLPPADISIQQDSTSSDTWTIGWNDTGAAGYRLHIGISSGTYPLSIDAGAQTSYTLSNVPGGITYYLAVTAYDARGNESMVSPEGSFTAAQPAGQYYQEDNPLVSLHGSWSRQQQTAASDGGYVASETPGDTLTFPFMGNTLRILRRVAPDGGQASVSIDGVPQGTLEFFFDYEERWQVPALFDHLGEGPHVMTLRVSESADADSTGHRVAFDAWASPADYVPSGYQEEAIDQLNWYRSAAGIPLVRGTLPLHLGSENNAVYQSMNSGDAPHTETAGNPGYTGEKPADRGRYAGYLSTASENAAEAGPGNAINGLINTVYHRGSLFDYSLTEIGAGFGSYDSGGPSTFLLGYMGFENTLDERLVYTYPYDGQTDVPLAFEGNEWPEPLPDNLDEYPVGYVVSLHIVYPDGTATDKEQWQYTTAELRGPDGQSLPAFVLDYSNQGGGTVEPDEMYLMTRDPLAANTTYTAHMAGTDSSGKAFDHTWSFTTQHAGYVRYLQEDIGSCQANLWWYTNSTEISSTVEYGLTTSYTHRVTAQAYGSAESGELTGLLPNTTYHYRVLTEDTQGNTYTTEDHTFTTGTPQTLHVPADYASIQEALRNAGACDTVQVAAGTYQEDYVGVPTGVSLVGDGAETTTIEITGTYSLEVSDMALVRGFTIHKGTDTGLQPTIWARDSSPTLSNNRIAGGAYMSCASSPCERMPVLRNNIFTLHGLSASQDNPDIMPIVLNNVFAESDNGMYLPINTMLARNNIVVNNQAYGIVGIDPSQVGGMGYNNVWNNTSGDYYAGSADATDLSIDPQFVGADDYQLQSGSPMIDAGDPAAISQDPDGSRNDMGAYGGPFANQDDTGGMFHFEHETSTVDESQETFTVTVKLMAALSETVTVDYLTIDGTATALEDYTAVSGTLTFASGAISQTIAVPIIDDNLAEPTETLQLWLHQSVGAPLGPRINTTLTIQDNDHVTPSVTLSANESTLQEHATKPAVVQVRRDAGTRPLTITYTVGGSATAGKDYNNLSGSVVLPSGATHATIEVIPINDRDIEGDETLSLTLEDGDDYDLGAGDQFELTIADNDQERTATASPHTGDTMTVSASEVGINIAPGSVQQETEVVYTDLGPDSPTSSRKGSVHAGHWFTLAMNQQGRAVAGTVLDPPLRVTLWYDDTDMGEADEEALTLYQWDDARTAWQPAGTITLLDTASNVLMVLLDGPGEYALFYQTQPAQVTVEATQSRVKVGGSTIIEVTVTSAQEKPLSGQTVSLGTTLGSLDPFTAETDASGVLTATLNAGSTIGEALVTATIGDLTDSISVTIVVGEPEDLAMGANRTNVVVGSTASITLTVQDGYNHLLVSTPITLSTTLGSLTPQSVTTDADGQAMVTFDAGPTVGEALVTAYTGDITESLSFSVIAGDLDEMTVEAAETEITVGTSTTVSATLTDAYDNPITSQQVGFHTTRGSIAPEGATTDEHGQAVVTLDAGPTAGEAIITVQSVTLSRQITIAITEEATPSPPDQPQVTVDEQQGRTLRVEDQETGELLLEADIPAGAVQQSTTIKYAQMSGSPTTLPPGTDVVFAGHWFKLEAYQNETLVSPMQFAKPISLTVVYQDPSLSASEEQAVNLYHLVPDDNTWTATGVVQQRDAVQNRIIVSLDHLTTFGVFYQADEGSEEEVVYLPLLQK